MTNYILIRDSDSTVISFGRDYILNSPTNATSYKNGNVSGHHTIIKDTFSIVDVGSSDAFIDIRIGRTSYVNGAFIHLSSQEASLIVNKLLTDFPEMHTMSSEERVEFANSPYIIQKITLTDFFLLCAQEGATVSDFKEIWNYERYYGNVSDSVITGDYNRLVSLIQTIPFTISAETSTAINIVINNIKLSRADQVCIELQLDKYPITIADV